MIRELILTLKRRWRLWTGLAVSLSLLFAALIASYVHVGECGASACIYPLQMNRDGAAASVNPNYKLRRILQSDDFARHIEAEHGIDYRRQVNCYETHQHEHVITVYARDTATALQALEGMLRRIEATFWGYNSSKIALESDYDEAAVEDYRWSDEGCRAASLTEVDTSRAAILCFDVVETPHITGVPSAMGWMKILALAIVIALVAASGITLFADKLFSPCGQAC